jgi:CotH kinase protein
VHMLGKAPPAVASRDFVGAVFAVFEPREGRARLNGAATWTGRLGVKVRGRSSRRQPKPSYTIEIRGDDEEDLPIPLLGMPREGDWVLYAPYVLDRSLVRNALMYELSRRIGRYAPRTRFCELYFVANHADLQSADYAGVYVLTERLTRGDERIDVHKLTPSAVAPSAVTGGYVVKVDDPDVPGEAFSAADRTFVYVEPHYDEIVPEQAAYISEYLASWHRAISADDGFDPLTGNAFDALMDIPSFVDHHILNMFGKNPDAFALSAYYHKDRGGPLQAGPLWDMDLGLGNVDDPYKGLRRSFEPTEWGPMLGHALFTRTPYADLFKHPEFTEAYWTRWEELLASTLTTHTVREVFAGYAVELAEAELRNRTRWPEMAPASGSFEAELDVLGNWVEARLQWIHTQIGVLP